MQRSKSILLSKSKIIQKLYFRVSRFGNERSTIWKKRKFAFREKKSKRKEKERGENVRVAADVDYRWKKKEKKKQTSYVLKTKFFFRRIFIVQFIECTTIRKRKIIVNFSAPVFVAFLSSLIKELISRNREAIGGKTAV